MNILESKKDKKGILRLTLNDPNNKNALSELMIKQLSYALNEATEDKSIRVIVIAATGNVFCSGHNLKEIINTTISDKNFPKVKFDWDLYFTNSEPLVDDFLFDIFSS